MRLHSAGVWDVLEGQGWLHLLVWGLCVGFDWSSFCFPWLLSLCGVSFYQISLDFFIWQFRGETEQQWNLTGVRQLKTRTGTAPFLPHLMG